MSLYIQHRHKGLGLASISLDVNCDLGVKGARRRSHSWSYRTCGSEMTDITYSELIRWVMSADDEDTISTRASSNSATPTPTSSNLPEIPPHEADTHCADASQAAAPAASEPTNVEGDAPANSDPKGRMMAWVLDTEALDSVTFMVRNIPPSMTRAHVEELLKRTGFEGLWDFLYMPMCMNTKHRVTHKGHAFINILDKQRATVFYERWNRRKVHASWPHLNVSLAQVQGREANIQKWSSSKTSHIRNKEYRPKILSRD
eukprot:gnl/TRDRNA2_/TRDRNA2_168114_c0_seq2.p1 gnl/TRDRNA2_/TRDRNA2_168114_c0~~gnl/TRDRNA2_/TRDRNA2_168114_c0_seq2.p1  ORF type:complete len:259 (-),score=42.05 gnl/TRDRNA2_/TRDRNA2_168114_c0_seq2:89-865(-)